ncbi:MAG: ribonuclease HII [Thermodesulfobacteriota bacterium]|nr:ribonuclease HII [Thermodesulfobacteriota bacterium]
MPLSLYPTACADFPEPFAGVDEAGRGCLAGPVAAAAVILPKGLEIPGLADSKKLSADARAALEPEIKALALAWGVGLSRPREIERVNILKATLKAMQRAVNALKIAPDFLIIDGCHTLALSIPQKAVVKADLKIPAVSAASVLAKTFRDRLLTKLDARYPGYGLCRHKGYGTKEHLDALSRLGPSPVHRMSFKGVRQDKDAQKVPEELCLPDI